MYRNERFRFIWSSKCVAVVLFSIFTFTGFSFAGDSSLFVQKAMNNKITEIKQLIKSGTDVNSTDDDGNTGLHWAASFGLQEMAKILISNGANVNLINNEGNAPLHWAAGQGNIEIVKLLIANGADVNAKGKSDWTPLRWAEATDNKDIVEILREAGAKP